MNAFESLLTAIEEQPLSQSLPRVLSVASAVSAKDLADWVRLELMGYYPENPAMHDDVKVPRYRAVVGLWHDDYGRPFVIEDPRLYFVNELPLRQGVAELEGYSTATGMLASRELNAADVIQKALSVPVTTFTFDSHGVAQVLTNIKVRLLDQLAQYRDEISALPVREAQTPGDEVLKLAPEIYGVGVDLKALWRKLTRHRKT